MNRKAIDWVNFLNTDPFQKFGIRKYGSGLSPRIKDYLTADEFADTFAAWMNDPVIKVWHNNWTDDNGFAYHLLEVDC
jgi:hypothetical protein